MMALLAVQNIGNLFWKCQETGPRSLLCLHRLTSTQEVTIRKVSQLANNKVRSIKNPERS